ncbi:MAG TPA: LmbU family transcriptional regulator [Gaiellaceae bacterium]
MRGAVPNAVGMRFHPRLPFEDWHDLGQRLSTYASASQWWLGDWLAFGQEKYGRRYKMGVALTGLDYQTLRNYAMVCRRFPLSRRRDSVSFAHHAEVCALDDEEQDQWLERATAARWSRNELRRRLRSSAGTSANADDDLDAALVLRLAVERDRQERWHEAAARCARDFDAWVVETLDREAEAQLTTD